MFMSMVLKYGAMPLDLDELGIDSFFGQLAQMANGAKGSWFTLYKSK